MKKLNILAILMAAITFAACSADDNIISEQTADRTFTLVVEAAKGDVTRALTLDGTTLKATWTAGDAVTVYNVTRSASLTGTLIAQSSGSSTTLVGALTGTIMDGDVLKLKFLSPTYTTQDGTLAGIASSCDYAEATVTVNDASTPTVTTTPADFANQQAIVKFTLKNKTTNAALNATKLTVTVGGTIINVTPAAATDVLYVAIPGIGSQTVYLSATAGGTSYTYEKSGVTLTNGKYYGFTVSMETAPDVSSQALTFEAKEAGAKVTFTKASSVANQIEYSTDGSTWIAYSEPITLANVGDKVYFRGNNAAYGSSLDNSSFSCSKGCYIYGNIMSLISSTGFATVTELTEDYTFKNLFTGGQIYSHPSKQLLLPATTLTKHCYDSMFKDCTSLTTAPELPATTLADECYYLMFFNCNHLTTAPELSATSLADYCYCGMFYYCTNLTSAPDLPAETLAKCCYANMFENCTNLTAAPALPATTLFNGCYLSMFKSCSKLTTAPALPATTLAEDCCYKEMFSGCALLTTAPALPATTVGESSYEGMFSGCTHLTMVPDMSATTLAARSCFGMFEGCTSLTAAPALPATTLASDCCLRMFNGCTSLITAPAILPATTLASDCYLSMFNGCTSLTTAPELPATTLAHSCYYTMFKGCTNLTTAPDLPATTLVGLCYKKMFDGCTNLTSVKCLATDISATECTKDWLNGVDATGTFTKATGADWSGKTGADGIPSGWTVNNVSIMETTGGRSGYGTKDADIWN